jgi:hypothetical protein
MKKSLHTIIVVAVVLVVVVALIHHLDLGGLVRKLHGG